MENRPMHPLAWLAVGLGSLAVTVAVLVGGLLYGMSWLRDQPTSVTNPVYLIIGISVSGLLIIGHDLIDAIGDAFKARANQGKEPDVDWEAMERAAKARELNARAARHDREGLPPPPPRYAEDAYYPARNGGPGEYTG